jgi:hypothetical protein
MNIDSIKEEFFIESTKMYLDKAFDSLVCEMVLDDR